MCFFGWISKWSKALFLEDALTVCWYKPQWELCLFIFCGKPPSVRSLIVWLCLLPSGGLAALLFVAWWSWSWPSTTWACCAARWAMTNMPHLQHGAASPIQEERCLWRKSSMQSVKSCHNSGLCCYFNAYKYDCSIIVHVLVVYTVIKTVLTTACFTIKLQFTVLELCTSAVPQGLFVHLHSGVGFSFLFSWVLMGVVTIIFLAGGNMEKLVCEPFHTKELFKASHAMIREIKCKQSVFWLCKSGSHT